MPANGYHGTNQTEIKKSRFICDLARTDSEAEARAFIASIRSQYPDASHHCSAFVIMTEAGLVTRSSDDGEPAGSAGVPMMNALTMAGVKNVVAVVTRYYGGTDLGIGGLIRAYSGSVARAVAEAPLVQRVERQIWRLTVSHTTAGQVQEALLRAGAEILDLVYQEDVSLLFICPGDVEALVARITQGAGLATAAAVETIEVALP